jgi:hypothetical protein
MVNYRQLCVIGIFISIFINSCGLKQQSLNKTWFFAYNATSVESIREDQALTPENFIDLQEDGSFTSYIGGFEYGKWEKDGNRIQLKNQKGDNKVVKVISLKDGELTLDLAPEFENRHYQVFTGVSNENTKREHNPFSIENNKWRVRSSTSETSEQIKDRLVNHFRFWEKYFEWAVANDLETLDIRSTNSALKLYSNGFVLIPYDELSDRWRSNFFDDADCQQAWNKLKKMIDTKNVVWPKTENRFKFFISGFQQLQRIIE